MRFKTRLAFTMAVLTVGTVAYSQPVSQNRSELVSTLRSKIMAGDAHEHDCFGRSLAISGKYIIAGAKGEDTGAKDSGAAYIFERKNGDYIQIAKLKADRPHANDYFGFTVGIDGETAIVGAWQDKEKGKDAGAVYVFVREGDTWVQQAKLTARDASDFAHFGYFASISGDRIAVGAREESLVASGAGAAYVFRREGSAWIQEAKLSAPSPKKSQQFGWSVAIDGDRVLVGAVSDVVNGMDSGSAYLFRRTGANWKLESQFLPTDPKAEQRFGYAVALHGGNAIVGAYRDNSGGFESGAAYIFENTGKEWGTGHKLSAGDARPSQFFGWSVAVDGPMVVVGAWYDGDGSKDPLGSAYVFHKSGNSWVQEKKLVSSQRTPMQLFGWAVGLSGKTVAIGARLDDEAASQAGAIYWYDKQQAWPQDAGSHQ